MKKSRGYWVEENKSYFERLVCRSCNSIGKLEFRQDNYGKFKCAKCGRLHQNKLINDMIKDLILEDAFDIGNDESVDLESLPEYYFNERGYLLYRIDRGDNDVDDRSIPLTEIFTNS